MKPSEALQSHRETIRQLAEQYHVRNVRVFGSVLHGDIRQNVLQEAVLI